MKGLSPQSMSWLLGCFILFSLQGTAWGHSVSYTLVEDGKPVVVKFYYSDGSAISYAEIKVWAPDDARLEYQIGRTDKNGRFAFLPSQPGTWKFALTDGRGHALSGNLDMTDRATLATPAQGRSAGQKATIVLALLGVSLLLNIGFICQYLFSNTSKVSQGSVG